MVIQGKGNDPPALTRTTFLSPQLCSLSGVRLQGRSSCPGCCNHICPGSNLAEKREHLSPSIPCRSTESHSGQTHFQEAHPGSHDGVCRLQMHDLASDWITASTPEAQSRTNFTQRSMEQKWSGSVPRRKLGYGYWRGSMGGNGWKASRTQSISTSSICLKRT